MSGASPAVIGRVCADDLAAIMIMEREAFGTTSWSTDGWRAELDGAGRDVLVARAEGAVVGVITVQTVDVTADLHRLIIADGHRRQGIGTALIDAAVRAARERGANQMLLEVEASNDAGVAVYQRYGFEQLASRPDYYGPGRPALIMKLYELTGPVPVTVDWVPDGATRAADHEGRR